MTSKILRDGQHLCRRVHHKSSSLDIFAIAGPTDLPAPRTYASTTASRTLDDSVGQQHQTHRIPKSPLGKQAQQKAADREFFADLLSSAATKRDAKAYLTRLKSPSTTKPPTTRTNLFARGSYVNLGNLFPGSRAAEQSPIFSQSAPDDSEFEESETLHVALVKIQDVAKSPERILRGIAETLAQLNRLSISPCVVIEGSQNASRAALSEEADILVAAINGVGHSVARRVDNVFSTTTSGQTMVSQRKLLLRPLRQGQIPVVTTVAYNEDEQSMTVASALQATLALTKEFAGLNVGSRNDGSMESSSTLVRAMQKEISLDRLITIDSAGGILNEKAADGRHVFLNLEQEYDVVKDQLMARSQEARARTQLSNLNLLRQTLQLLPPTSSGLMTTCEEAANVKSAPRDRSASSVGTRRQKNMLIHNLLTDKPAYSSSLPVGRLGQKNENMAGPMVSHSSFVKRGMHLTILPDPFREPWVATAPRLKLTDPRIDLGRLIYLIEDSFGRKLDVEDYLNRVDDRIAGVIIAGEYEGGAILTWETPPTTTNAEPVPYLDKFAVLRRSQGAGGVADIVFNAMVRSCFPNGVCWRSRGGNPVNKWYMERSRGTWKLSKAWTMFWTTPGVEMDTTRFRDYEAVCRGVRPSWADRQKPAD